MEQFITGVGAGLIIAAIILVFIVQAPLSTTTAYVEKLQGNVSSPAYAEVMEEAGRYSGEAKALLSNVYNLTCSLSDAYQDLEAAILRAAAVSALLGLAAIVYAYLRKP